MLSLILAAALVQEPLAPITVRATPANALPIASVDSQALRRDIRPSLAAQAARLPGVRAVSTGAIIAKPVIRGLGGARVLTTENGYRLEDYSWSDEDAPSLDPRLSERIEVLRGPASLLYGSDAIGGVVNAIAEPLPFGERRLRTELFGATNNPGVGAGLEYGRGRDNMAGLVHLVGHFAGPTVTPDCELENTGFSSLNGEAAFGLRGATSAATLRVERFGGEFKLLEAGGIGFTAPPGCPGGPPKPAADTAGGPERKVEDLRVQLGGRTLWHGLALEARSQVQSHTTIELSDDITPGVETETIHLRLLTSTLDLLAHHRHGTIGVSGMLQDNATSGQVAIVPDGTVRNAAAFAIERLPLGGRANLLAGARIDLRRTEANRIVRNNTAVTGDVGITYDVTRAVQLAANVGRAFRAPNLVELYSNGPRLGENRYEVGDSTLKPEISLNVDASLRWQGGRFRGEVGAYRNRIEDFIYFRPTGAMSGGANPLPVYQYDHARATLTGMEAAVALDLTPRVTTWVRGDLVRGQNDTQGEPLPLMPPARGLAGLRYHRARWYIGTEAEAVAKQTRLAPNDIPTAGYVLIGFEGGHQLNLGGRRIDLDARLRNATNRRYRNYLNRYKEFALDAGIGLEVRLATDF